MIGSIIAKIRKDRKLSKTDLAKKTNINIGHLTHIEKEERNPSHRTLKCICQALDVPFQPLMYTYDKDLSDDQKSYNVVNHIKYDSIPIFDGISGFQKCPADMQSASLVIKVFDSAMAPKIPKDSYIYLELNCPLDNKDIGLFQYNNELIIRKFIIRKKDLVLRADDDSVDEIIITKDSDFYIIGKVLGLVKK